MANHCTYGVCRTCGAEFCLICHEPAEAITANVKALNEALGKGDIIHHYPNIVCHVCEQKTVYQLTVPVAERATALKLKYNEHQLEHPDILRLEPADTDRADDNSLTGSEYSCDSYTSQIY